MSLNIFCFSCILSLVIFVGERQEDVSLKKVGKVEKVRYEGHMNNKDLLDDSLPKD